MDEQKPKKKYIYARKTQWYDGHKYEATGKTEKEAIRKLADKIAAAKRGEGAVGGGMTVDAWFEKWFQTYKAPKGLTPKAANMYGWEYRKHIKPAIGTKRLKDVREVDLQGILNANAGKSASLVKKLRMILQGMFKRARQSRLIVWDPAETLELPAVTEGHHRALTEDERASLTATAATHRRGLWILTLLYTGMRPAESVALTWEDIDLVAGEIHIRRARESGSRRLKEPKTEAGIRDIPVHAELLPLLEAAKAEALQSGAALTGYVFPGAKGQVADENTVNHWWRTFRRAMDIQRGAKVYRNKVVETTLPDDLTLYCLRHTFATDLQRVGVPLNVAKELMGHRDIMTTANVYTHRDTAVLHAWMKRMDTGRRDK